MATVLEHLIDSLPPTGDYERDCRVGRALGEQIIADMRASEHAPHFLLFLARKFGERSDGIVVGAWTSIGLAIRH